jgi:hypothetical protein
MLARALEAGIEEYIEATRSEARMAICAALSVVGFPR